MLRKSITLLLYSARGPNPPNARELRLCRLHSSIVYLSIIDEECGYRVPQPFGSWGSFMIPAVVLISVGMLALYAVAEGSSLRPMRSRTAQRSPAVTRSRSSRTMRSPAVTRSRSSRAMRSQWTPQRSPTSTVALTPVQKSVPNAPQESIL